MFALILACVAQPAARAAEGVPLRGGESNIYALVHKDGAASSMAHDHVIQATGATGFLVFDPAEPESLSVSVSIPTSGLLPDEDAMRTLVGLPDVLTPTQREEVKTHLLGDSQLAGDLHPTIEFKSTSLTVDSGTYLVTGDFSLRGVTKSITVPLKVAPSEDGVHLKGRFAILQSDYGYEPYSALLGALSVKDQVDIVVDLTF